MNEHINMANFIAPKSDQLNADDLIGGPRTITVTRVTGNDGNAEQPVNIFFDGDDGKPFRPCKSMRRVMVKIWGADTSKYPGRSLTIYRDPKVKWGGMEVGGIRISHMTEMDKPETMALTESKQNRRPYTVQPLKVEAKADKAAEGAEALIARINAAEDVATVIADVTIAKQRAWLSQNRPELAKKVDDAIAAKQPVDDDPFAEQPADETSTLYGADALIAKVDACTDLEALAAVEAEFNAATDTLGEEAARVDTAIVTMKRALEGRAK